MFYYIYAIDHRSKGLTFKYCRNFLFLPILRFTKIRFVCVSKHTLRQLLYNFISIPTRMQIKSPEEVTMLKKTKDHNICTSNSIRVKKHMFIWPSRCCCCFFLSICDWKNTIDKNVVQKTTTEKHTYKHVRTEQQELKPNCDKVYRVCLFFLLFNSFFTFMSDSVLRTSILCCCCCGFRCCCCYYGCCCSMVHSVEFFL